MNKRLIRKKRQLLQVISREDYYAILKFIEEIYLSKYDLKIFKARKMSNLYLALKELMLEEGGGRVKRKYRETFQMTNKNNEPIIIADWAFDYVKFLYPDKEIKSVLLIDDIIIHGRTLTNLYNVVIKAYPDVQVSVKTFVKNCENHIDSPLINEAQAVYEDSIDKCRRYSQIFVDIFMIMNQPYTSYVPNIAIRINGEEGDISCEIDKLREWIDSQNAASSLYQDAATKIPFLKTRVWVGNPVKRNILFPSLRIYHNIDSDDYAVVPMVSLMPISQNTLKKQLEYLCGEGIYTEIFEKRWLDSDVNVGRMDYRVLVYTMSTLWGRYFFMKRDVLSDYIDKDFEIFEEERMNFGGALLDRTAIGELDQTKIVGIFDKLETFYEPINTGDFMCPEDEGTKGVISKLDYELGIIVDDYKEPVSDVRLKWRNIIRNFLTRDSKLDEEQWDKWAKSPDIYKGEETPLRIPGLPIVLLLEHVDDDERATAYEEILKAIDQGEGSIVPEKVMITDKEDSICFVSSIHAGEQNYKYAEQKYYSVLYGMYLIERYQQNQTKKIKEKVHEEDLKNQIEEIDRNCTNLKEQLLKEMNQPQESFLDEMVKKSVSKEYGTPLMADFFLHVGEPFLDNVVKAVYKLTGRRFSNVL